MKSFGKNIKINRKGGISKEKKSPISLVNPKCKAFQQFCGHCNWSKNLDTMVSEVTDQKKSAGCYTNGAHPKELSWLDAFLNEREKYSAVEGIDSQHILQMDIE